MAAPKPNDGGTAFPGGDDATYGMSLRDYFAGQALPAILEKRLDGGDWDVAGAGALFRAATDAYAAADAMLDARERGAS